MSLNLAALLGRVNRSLEETSRFVTMGMSYADAPKHQAAPAPTGRIAIGFNSGLKWSDEEALSAWKNWVLRNGFREIAELISLILEEACGVLSFYSLLARQAGGEALSPASFEEREKLIARFHRFSLSDKLDWLLRQPSFALSAEKLEEVKSITAARNCLSHRAGIVGERDLTSAEALEVRWLGMDATIRTEDGELPFEPPMHLEKGGTLVTHIVRRDASFLLGERIIFNEHEFSEIAWTIFAFASTVASALEACGRQHGLEFAEAQG